MKKIFVTLSIYLSLAFFSGGIGEVVSWHSHYNAAMKLAKQQDKPVVMVFTGSDWSSWCQHLNQEVFGTEDFADKVGGDFILLTVDFPKKSSLSSEQRRHNEDLKAKFHVSTFPTVVLLDNDEHPIAWAGYRPGGSSQYADFLVKSWNKYSLLKSEVAQLPHRSYPVEKLEVMYRQAQEINCDDFQRKIFAAGIKYEDNIFFQTERYLSLVQKGKIDSVQARNLRQKLSQSDDAEVHYRLAIIDFQANNNAGEPHGVVEPMLQYLERFGDQDPDKAWRVKDDSITSL
ncbi:MAG: DUF255 domain-containing protein [Chlamydiota bacterium]